MLSSQFLVHKDTCAGGYVYFDRFGLNDYVYSYLKKYYDYLDVTEIIYSTLILDTKKPKLTVRFECIESVYNEPLLTFSVEDKLNECGHSSPKSINENFDIDAYIDACMKSLGYSKSLNLFTVMGL